MACCQADLDVGTDEERFGDRDRRRKSLGDGAGRRPLWDVVPLQKVTISGSSYRAARRPWVASARRRLGCPQRRTGMPCSCRVRSTCCTEVSSSTAISAADHSRVTYSSRRQSGSSCLRCARLVRGWTETPAVCSRIGLVSGWCGVAARSGPGCGPRRQTSGAGRRLPASPVAADAAAEPPAGEHPVPVAEASPGTPEPRTARR